MLTRSNRSISFLPLVMTKSTRLILACCLVAIIAVIVLQFYWVSKYYKLSLFNFERAVNLAFEDAVKKDFQLRCDTIEQLITGQLMDTAFFTIESNYSNSSKTFKHNIIDARDRKDFASFSHEQLPDSLEAGDTAYKKKIAGLYAKALRSEDLENHIVYYRTQNLGAFVLDKVRKLGFDSSRLRPVLQHYLQKRAIHTPFYFHTASADSLLNDPTVPASAGRPGFIMTKSFPTYKWWKHEDQYVRAVFGNPSGYVVSEIKWILGGSLFLIILVGLGTGWLLKALFREKRLSVIKNDFINNITHELKTPAATITAAIEALEDPALPKEKSARYLGHAKHEIERLTKLIDDILNISLYDHKGMQVARERIAIEETIHTIVDRLRLAANKPVNFQFRNLSGIDQVVADKLLFQQALINVIDNSIKYSGKEATIAINCNATEDYFQIQCADKGEGIPASSLPYIFEKFYREPKNKHAVKGFGLGLNYAQQIMKAHKGRIELKSIKGKGTDVILYWPL